MNKTDEHRQPWFTHDAVSQREVKAVQPDKCEHCGRLPDTVRVSRGIVRYVERHRPRCPLLDVDDM